MAKKRKQQEPSDRPQYSTLSAEGKEIPDSKPHAAALKIRRSPTPFEQMKEWLNATARSKEFEGEETFEEADDFDIPDDPADPQTPYEEFFEGEFDYHRQVRLDEQKTQTKARRGRKAAPRDAEKVSKEPDAKAIAPEPAPTVPQDGPART